MHFQCERTPDSSVVCAIWFALPLPMAEKPYSKQSGKRKELSLWQMNWFLMWFLWMAVDFIRYFFAYFVHMRSLYWPFCCDPCTCLLGLLCDFSLSHSQPVRIVHSKRDFDQRSCLILWKIISYADIFVTINVHDCYRMILIFGNIKVIDIDSSLLLFHFVRHSNHFAIMVPVFRFHFAYCCYTTISTPATCEISTSKPNTLRTSKKRFRGRWLSSKRKIGYNFSYCMGGLDISGKLNLPFWCRNK